MLVTFQSKATSDVVMLRDLADTFSGRLANDSVKGASSCTTKCPQRSPAWKLPWTMTQRPLKNMVRISI